MKHVKTVAISAAIILGLGAATATADSLITSSKIKDGAVHQRDLTKRLQSKLAAKATATVGAPGAVGPAGATGAQGERGATGATGSKGATGAKGEDGTNGKNGIDGAVGPQGPQGPQGEPGNDGSNGHDGVSGYEVRTFDYDNVGPGGVATVACSSTDKVAVSGGFYVKGSSEDMSSPMPALTNGAGVVASFPGRMDWSTNTPRPNRLDGWIMRFNSNPAGAVTLYAVCMDR